MKKSVKIRCFLVLIMISFACEKIELKREIAGTWEVKYIGGGETPTEVQPNITHLRIKKNGNYSIFNLDTLKASGLYAMDRKCPYDIKTYEPFMIQFKNKTEINTRLTFPFNEYLLIHFVSKDAFILYPYNCADCLEFAFEKSIK